MTMADGPRTSSAPTSSRYRPREATLVDFGERASLNPTTSTEKNRFLLTILTGPAKGQVFKLEQPVVTVGRSDQADIALPDPGLSRVHAQFVQRGSTDRPIYVLEDCNSTNGTYAAGAKISEPTPLSDGMRIGFGKRTLARFGLQDELEEQAIVSVHNSAIRDGLTNAHNRRVFDDRLKAELAFSLRHGQPLSLLLMDIDHFKRFNDTYGHQAGDRVLQVVAERVSSTLRTEDLFARYGGEEFAVLVRNTSVVDALVVAERIRRLIEEAPVPWQGQSLHVTVSIGVTCNGASEVAPDALVNQADGALYGAKEQGRNRVVVFDGD
jgi:diguanylate cyclase (GGDEF)-like protein